MFLVSSCSCLCQSNEARCQVENEDVDGAAPTGDAPTTSEWATILLPTKVRLILQTWRVTSFELPWQAASCKVAKPYLSVTSTRALKSDNSLDIAVWPSPATDTMGVRLSLLRTLTSQTFFCSNSTDYTWPFFMRYVPAIRVQMYWDKPRIK